METPSDTLYIKQQNPDNDLFRQLERQSLEDYQQSAGKVWTDYNLHDPGITITDVINYALTELDYRLRFPLQDYLTAQGKPFRPENFGFYSPSDVFPVSPVTADDYRKYFLNVFPEIENIWFVPAVNDDRYTGKYHIQVEASPYSEKNEQEELINKIARLYHAKRNLCEEMETIGFIQRENLIIHGEIQIEPNADSLELLARIYWDTHAYLAGYPHYHYPDAMAHNNISPDEWLDGPLENGLQIDFPGPVVPTKAELYQHIVSLPGVISVQSFHLEDREGRIINTFHNFYSVHIPTAPEEMKVQLWTDNTPVTVPADKLGTQVRAFYLRHKGQRIRQQNKKLELSVPEGNYHPLYKHDTIQEDFPALYGIGQEGLSAHEPDSRKGQAMQLKAYLLLFDLIFARGAEELKEVYTLLSQKASLPKNNIPPVSDTSALWNLLVDKEVMATWEKRTSLHQKEQLADMWDKLYGEDSRLCYNPEFSYYDEVPEETLFRRIEFLKNAPAWGYNRFRACNMYGRRDARNVPGIKTYITTLLGWECNEGHAIGNLFPVYNMSLVSDSKFFEIKEREIKYTLMPDNLLEADNLEQVPYVEVSYTDVHYEELRMKFPLLHSTVLFESFFHEGIHLENYKIIHIRKEDDYILVFGKNSTHTYVNLGHFTDKDKLIEAANRLRLFLVMMNRKSETLYIVEHIYFPEPEPFRLTIVLPDWSARMSVPHFRETFKNFILNRLPAHIEVNFRWLDMKTLWDFELNWSDWRRKYAQGSQDAAASIMNKIKDIIQ
ncbi:MAG: hypothetical protein LIP00_03705 [Parabacteroides sp.]|nr:hypothetical protein [Parabacteroides sp.]